jgi:hypothetical protein
LAPNGLGLKGFGAPGPACLVASRGRKSPAHPGHPGLDDFGKINRAAECFILSYLALIIKARKIKIKRILLFTNYF